jgi:hypothetical protein
MSSRPVSPQISEDEFEGFLALMGSGSDFPQTYDDWMEYRRRNDEGRSVNSIEVSAQEFSDYCNACGPAPSPTMLEAFATAKQRKSTQT